MKKTFVMAMGLALTAAVSFAADPTPSSTPAATPAVTKAPAAKAAVKSTPEATPVATMAAAGTPAAGASDNGQVVVQVQGGVAIPASNGLSAFSNSGPAFEGLVGYTLSQGFVLGLEGGYDQWNNEHGNGGVNHIPVELVGKLNLITNGLTTPYVQLGVGVAFDYSTNFIPNETNFELDPAIGESFTLAKDFNLFVQGTLDMDFAPTAETKMFSSKVAADSLILAIPVQLGLSLAL